MTPLPPLIPPPSYRNQYMTTELSAELEYSQQLVKPLLAALQALSRRVAAAGAAGDAATLVLALQNATLICSIFYSLNSPGLTEVLVFLLFWGGWERADCSTPGPVTARWLPCPTATHPPTHSPAHPPTLPHPQAFEETLDAWMAELHTYLTFESPLLPPTPPGADADQAWCGGASMEGGARGGKSAWCRAPRRCSC